MLAGILAITNSLSWMSIPLSRLLVLITTLNIYEAALIALAYYLIRVRGLGRDETMLLVLEAFFLIDITFLNAEVVTSHLGLGVAVNVVLFLAAVVKLGVIGHLMGVSPRDGRMGAMVVQVAVLFALPVVFRWMDGGSVSPGAFYAAWWVIGLLIPVSVEMGRRSRLLRDGRWDRKTLTLYMALPWLSLVLHAGILHYVYDVRFYGAEAAPLLLGLAFLLEGVDPSKLMPRKDLLALRLLLPAAAVGVSLNNPAALCFGLSRHGAILFTPARLAGGAAYMSYVLFFVRPYVMYFAAAGVAMIPVVIYGPTAQQILVALGKLWDRTGSAADRVTPKTGADWGTASIAAAFAFLGLGAAVSLRRRRIEPAAEEASASDN